MYLAQSVVVFRGKKQNCVQLV